MIFISSAFIARIARNLIHIPFTFFLSNFSVWLLSCSQSVSPIYTKTTYATTHSTPYIPKYKGHKK